MEIKVSVIIPVFNGEKYLKKALQSLKCQTFTDFEAIIINDGSTDGTQEIIDEFCTKDDRFRGYYQFNSGVSAARNKGNELAKGEFISYLDDDDTFPEDAIEKLHSAITERNADIAIGINRIADNGDEYETKSTQRLGEEKVINRWNKDLVAMGSVCNRMFRRSLIADNDIKFINREIVSAEDSIFNYNCFLYSHKITGCNSVVYNYFKRQHVINNEYSLSQVIDKEQIERRKRSYQTIANFIEEMEKMDAENLSEPERSELLQQYHETKIANTKRYINILLLDKAYSKIWSLDEDVINIIRRYISEELKALDDISREAICKKSRYFNSDYTLASKSEILDKTVFSVILGSEFDDKTIKYLLNSLYEQEFPFFELLIPEEVFKFLPDTAKKIENIRVIEKTENREKRLANARKMARGKCLLIIEDPVFVNRMTFKNVYKKYIRTQMFREYDYLELSLKSEEGQPINKKQDMLSNKVFARRVLREKGFVFSSAAEKDLAYLRNEMKVMNATDTSLVYIVNDDENND